MRKYWILSIILVVFLSVGFYPRGLQDHGDFPDIYVDESVAPGGVGSLADPYSDFSEINWTTGGDNSIFDYLAGAPSQSPFIQLMEGETWDEKLVIGCSGMATYPIIIGSYGSGVLPIITAVSDVTGWDTEGNWASEWESAVDNSPPNVLSPGERNYRQIVAADVSSYSGSKIRIKVGAHADGAGVIDGSSIGVMTAIDDFDAAPTRITWVDAGGGNGRTIPAGTTETSDEITFDFDKTIRHAVHFYCADKENLLYESVGAPTRAYYDVNGVDDTLTQVVTYDTATENLVLGELEVFVSAANVWIIDLAADPYRLFIDGTEYIEAADEADIDSTYRWWYDATNDLLYVYATENPATAYSTMQRGSDVDSPLSRAVSISTKDYITLENLNIQGGYHGVHIGTSSHAIIDTCTIGLYSAQGITTAGTGANPVDYAEIKDCTIASGYSNSTATHLSLTGDGIEFWNGTEYCKIHDCTISNWSHNGVYLVSSDATAVCNNNEIYDNIIESPNTNYCRGYGCVGTGTDDICSNNLFYRNLIQNTTARNQIQGNDNEFYYNIIDTITLGAYDNAEGRTYSPRGISLFGDGDDRCFDNKVYNNVIYNVADDGINVYGSAGYQNVSGILIRNNIIMNWGASAVGIEITDHATVLDCTYQNNSLYKSGVTDVVSYRGTLRTIAEFNAENGSNSDVIGSNIGGDPLMTDPANDDFTLNPHSPCVDAGTDVSLTEDYLGLKIRHAPDIGAYENQANALFHSVIVTLRIIDNIGRLLWP